MERTLFIDIETRSRTNLSTAGTDRYIEDPDFGVLTTQYAFDDEPVRVLFGEEELKETLSSALVDPAILKVSHNARFDRLCLSRTLLGGHEHLDPAQWEDTMALAAWAGFPLSLEALARAVRVEEKDTAGKGLIRMFSIPNRKGEFATPESHPDEWIDFLLYGVQDVETLRQIHRALPPCPTEAERRAWVAAERINDRGMKIDVELAEAATKQVEVNAAEAMEALRDITGLDNPNSVVQLGGWLEEQANPLPDLRADTVTEAIKDPATPEQIRRVLELRAAIAMSASKKYAVGLRRVCDDGRVRSSFKWFGAHTGRFSGSGLQPQNLPRAALADDAAVENAILDLKLGLGADAQTLKALVRPLFVGPYVIVDYSAIEARVVAWLAGEEWALQAFREGRDIYVETAKMMSTQEQTFTRQDGKTAVLGLGYGGGVNALLHMGAKQSTEELQVIVDRWREANQRIVTFWRELERRFMVGGPVRDHIVVERQGGVRRVVLPSGRPIVYRGVRVEDVETKFGIRKQASFADTRRNLTRSRTWGGTLTENCTQAVARDLLTAALVRLDEAGYPVVGHVHDEVIVEAAEGDVEEITRIMCDSPAWADGLPVTGEGGWTQRYKK